VVAAWVGASAVNAARPVPIGGLTALPVVDANGANLLKNSGFETGSPSPATIPEWHTLEGDALNLDNQGKTGRSSVRMTNAARQKMIATTEQTVTLEPGLYTIAWWVKTDKLGENAAGSGARMCLDGRPRLNWWQCTEVARGTMDWTQFRQPSIPVTDAGTYRVTIGAYARPEGAAWFDDISLTAVGRPPVEAFLLYPNFRGLLFDDRPQTIRLALTASRPAAGDKIRLSLVDEARGTVVQTREYPASAPRGELDATALAPGPVLVRTELVSASGTSRYRYPDYRVVKTPAAARADLRVWYDERNVTHLDGKPRFVLGLYTTGGYSNDRGEYANANGGWGVTRMAEAPLDMLINYHLGAAPLNALGTYMDELRSRGIYYLQTVNFYHRDHRQYGSIPYPAAREGEDALNRWVAQQLGAHQGLGGFYTADEQPAEMMPKVFRQHRVLSEAAPGTVTYVVQGDGWETQAALWRDALDVLGLDPYPIVKKTGQNNVAMVGEWTRMGQDAVMESRPIWMVLQFFPMTTEGGWPSYDEIKSMSWMAIVEGARGLFYWSFGEKGLTWVKDLRERQAHWSDLVRVTKEIKALEPVLLAPDAAVVSRSSNDRVRVLGKRMADGTRYVFAYNRGDTSATVTWTFAEPVREMLDLDATRSVASDATHTERFAPYEVKRYRLK
jgi:hypothetical protein